MLHAPFSKKSSPRFVIHSVVFRIVNVPLPLFDDEAPSSAPRLLFVRTHHTQKRRRAAYPEPHRRTTRTSMRTSDALDLLGPIVRTPIRGPSTAAAASTPRTTHMCARAHTHTMAPSTIVYSCFVSRMPSRCRSHLWSLTLCARGDLQPVCVRQPVSTSRLIGMLSPAARTSGRIVYALWVHVLPYISLRPPLSTLASYGAPQTQLKPCRRSSLLRG